MKFWRNLSTSLLASSLLISNLLIQPTQAQTQLGAYCQSTVEAIAKKDNLRRAAYDGDKEAMKRYKAIVAQQAEQLKKCRSKNWPQTQAIWIRLYPCDIKPGVLESALDRIVDRGYNQVNVEVFYSGQVLLPSSANPTAWPSVLRTPGTEKVDLFAQALQKGRERGLKVYAWMFTLNFGYSYTFRPDRQQVVARNGKGQVSLSIVGNNSLNFELTDVTPEEAFVDPYSPQAKYDYYQMVQAVLQRRPDGILFDYIRYPRGAGTSSVASNVLDLWIYGEASQQALFDRAQNYKGLELIRRFLSKGYITAGDVGDADRLYPKEGEPLWEGRNPPKNKVMAPAADRQPALQQELWYLTAAHAVQGVIDFLAMASLPAQKQGIPAGAVFFPEANQVIGQGFDSRLQAWDRFPTSLEWHPMAYGVCGNVGCILSQIQRVLTFSPSGTQIKPVLAGIWGQSISNRPSLEVQMQAIRQTTPQLNSISHFAYSWQEPASDRERKFCQPK
ncbi:hypothetical protein BST81_19850 [Leptolyngbya sp. 'hensonii']|uniref:hypothetical protein n=1 Tax=Leptolyngbya sp. 'hensonii' TaxID=1922337 RepID=UPI00094FFDBE|nr:hypothetical protein [Leptolyngbya sp. 'hensonii']OLP16694.1 hypothetical protein BST81_19850 [Leptolyngbya sp. 'hensonii']